MAATKKKSKPKAYKGKSTAPGMGGSFMMMTDALMKKGMSKASAGAIAAKAGVKKYGKAKMKKFAIQGRKRAARKGKK